MHQGGVVKKVSRINPRPRMSIREYQSEEGASWSISVTMVLREVEAILGERPNGECSHDNSLPCILRSTLHHCDACHSLMEWNNAVLDMVGSATGRSFLSFYSGPGRRFASDPLVSLRVRRPYILRIYWSGGLDI